MVRKIIFFGVLAILFACTKKEEIPSQKELSVQEIIYETEKVNALVYSSVEKVLEELQNSPDRPFTMEAINLKIEEKTQHLKPLYERDLEITTPLNILENYITDFSKKLDVFMDNIEEDMEKEEFLILLNKEKDIYVKNIINDSELSEKQKKDVLKIILISYGKFYTEINFLEQIENLQKPLNQSPFFKSFGKWLSRQFHKIKGIVNSCAFGVGATIVGGVSYFSGVGTAVGVPLFKMGLPRLGYCFKDR